MSYPSLENRMDTTDKFLRFAAECEAMAKISPSRENKVLWNGLAQRWLRCAQLTEKLDSDLQSFGMRRRQARNAAEYRSPTERRIRHKARNTAEIAVSSYNLLDLQIARSGEDFVLGACKRVALGITIIFT